MNRTLILLTSGFPFFVSEGFLRDEIFVASDYFDRILIFAVNDKFEESLPLPTNVTAYQIREKSCTILKAINAFKYLFPRHESWKLLKENINTNFKMKLYYSYIKGLAEKTYSKVYKTIHNINFETDEQITLYSYWLNDLAYTAIKLKNTIFKNHQVKIVSRAHGGDLYEESNKMGFYPLKLYNIKYVDKVYACSLNGTHYLQDKFPEYANKIECRYLGSHDYGMQQIKPSGQFTIVSCSFCVPVKRINLIIDSLALCTSGRKIKWIHLGDGILYDTLKKYAGEKLNNIIDFEFYGRLRNDEVIDFYKNHYIDLFINTSRSEGVPFSIMEAMSFGIPVIATDVGGTRELVNENVGCLLKKDFHSEELVNKIMYFANMTEDGIEELRKTVRNQWNKSFNSLKNYNDFYQKLQLLWHVDNNG